MKLIMWLNVVPPDARDPLWSDGTLWTREVDTGCVPLVDDEVALWPDHEDGADGPLWRVKRRYMGYYGVWHVELLKMLLDPSDATVEELGRDARATGERMAAVWHTEDGGDPVPELERGRWMRR
jgi:hypothetical protein